MSTLEEKRVYSDTQEEAVVYVATGMGLVAVEVVADRVGSFGIERRGRTRSVAVADGRVAVATDDDVLLRRDDGEFDALAFGAATAVGFHDGDVLAASPDGEVARAEAGDWTAVGSVDGEVRAFDGSFAATETGVYQVEAAAVSYVGLDDVADVSAARLPVAATADGLYQLGNGWMRQLDGVYHAVTTDRTSSRTYAAGADVSVRDDGEWERQSVPTDEPITAIVASGAVYAVTADGTLLANAGDGWRSHALGLSEIADAALR